MGQSQQRNEKGEKTVKTTGKGILYIKEMIKAMEADREWSEEIQNEIRIADFMNWQRNSLQNNISARKAKEKRKSQHGRESTIERDR